MIGTHRWNLVFGMIAMIFTFLVSVSHNVLWTSLIGSIYSFLIAFIMGFFFRWVLGTVVGMKDMHLNVQSNPEDSLMDKGNNLDMTTPGEEEEIHRILKDHLTPQKEGDDEFVPLNPPKLVTKEKIDPEDLAKVLRHLSEE
ncbi:MAG TPA: hypothetical protein VGE40_02670 [Bacilli bacterium]